MGEIPRIYSVAWEVLVILAKVQKGQNCMEILPPGLVGTEVDTCATWI